jgi:Uncharacterized protein conserved in archaea
MGAILRIGIFFHGPKIFDAGFAERVIESLKDLGEVQTAINGTMGITACFDSFLEKEVQIEECKSSVCLSKLSEKNDLLVVVTYSKSPESGYAYCWHVIKRANVLDKPVIQIELSEMTLIPWTKNSGEIVKSFAKELSLNVKNPPDFGKVLWREGEKIFRKVLAVSPGDYLLINGMTAGKAISKDVTIVGLASAKGKIVEVRGVDLKDEASRKLDDMKIDVREAKLDTTKCLRDYKEARVLKVKEEVEGAGMAFVDHAGYDVYKIIKGCEGVVSVGDDTTTVVSDIAFRFDVPVIGIVDNDRDRILPTVHVHKRSELFIVEEDDEAGEKIFDEIFKRKKKIDIPFDDIKEKIAEIVEDVLIERVSMDLADF